MQLGRVFDLDTASTRVIELGSLGLSLDLDDAANWLVAVSWSPDGLPEFATHRALWRRDTSGRSASKVVDAPRPGAFTNLMSMP